MEPNLRSIIETIESFIEINSRKLTHKRIIQNRRKHVILSTKVEAYGEFLKMLKPFEIKIGKKLIKIDKLRNPQEEITMTKRKLVEEFNQEIGEILGAKKLKT